jgi:hypothetical protein
MKLKKKEARNVTRISTTISTMIVNECRRCSEAGGVTGELAQLPAIAPGRCPSWIKKAAYLTCPRRLHEHNYNPQAYQRVQAGHSHSETYVRHDTLG